MPQIIFLDFDGVIMETESNKVRMIEKLFLLKFPGITQIDLSHKCLNIGIPCLDKIRVLHQEYLGVKLSFKDECDLITYFEQLIKEEELAIPLVQGVDTFLSWCSAQARIVIISHSKKDDLLRMLKQKKIEKYISCIYGSLLSKEKTILAELKAHQIDDEHAVFIGDSPNDCLAAKLAGIAFITRLHDYNPMMRDNDPAILDFVGDYNLNRALN